MSWEFVTSILVFFVAVGFFLYYRSFNDKILTIAASDDVVYNKKEKLIVLSRAQRSFNLIWKAILGLSLILFIFSMFYLVPVRSIGIVTTFGRPTGDTTGSGLQVVAPWQRVADFDASVQTTKHLGNWGEGCTVTRIGSLATACVENIVQWQLTEPGGPKLFIDYKGKFESVSNDLVNTKIQNALNAVFATYNPLSQVNIQTGQVDFDGARLSKDVETKLKEELGVNINVLAVTVPLVHHDPQTESNIKQFQDVVAQSRILAQKKTNAEVEKTVADLQAQFLTPQYLQNKCIEESVKMGFAPGLCLMESGIVNAPTAKQ